MSGKTTRALPRVDTRAHRMTNVFGALSGGRVAHRASGFHMLDGIVRLPAYRVEARKRNARAAGDTLRAARSAIRA
ncbi:hypothetical protein A8H35_23540 [Burkholderia thailandensis]|nr:hypothetical protein WJ27_29070 [Burkholderia thailandensis]AVR07425.1 hypothetical protein A8H31_07970 [Burkholderia thailandensis]AWY61198.1 hypothetical protein A8H35_23540 [Burkholderia thailandensis]AWY65273.1 hypothetical protein A8H36_08685 [Burkholderia thailandensis]KVG17223.1 hypothetical protein WJ25_21260 [Burkholderia thailandensis]